MTRHRKITWILCLAAAFLLLFLVIVFFTGRRIYADPVVKRVPPSEINLKEVQSARKKVGTSLAQIRNASASSAPQTLVLSRKEFNALTESLLNFAGLLAKDMSWNGVRLQDTALLLNEDSVRLVFSKDTGVKTPFGSRVKSTVDLEVLIENGKSRLRIKSASVGTLPMPSALRTRMEKELAAFQASPEHRHLLDVVEFLSVRQGELRVKFRPFEAKKSIPSPVLQTSQMFLLPFSGPKR